MKKKTLILVHGRSWQPPRADLRKLWVDALRAGFARDYEDGRAALKGVRIEFVYFGDVSNAYLRKVTGRREPEIVAGRRVTLKALKELGSNDFTKRHYDALPGKTAMKEWLADVFSPALSFFAMGERYIAKTAPDLAEYWDAGSDHRSRVGAPILGPLRRALKRGDSVAVVAHSMGSIVAYDALWKLSHESEHVDLWDAKVDLFLSLGSPLGDATIQKHLRGGNCKEKRCFPTNIRDWVNIAAEDDYISHDSKIAGDFRRMKRLGIVDSIRDLKIYNLALRRGKSNPHHIGGYLIHPTTIAVLRGWLMAKVGEGKGAESGFVMSGETTGKALPVLARAQVTEKLGGTPEELPFAAERPGGYLAQRRGVFVTIWHPERGLRGCKGTMVATRLNLVEETRANALSAAFDDHRVPPVQAGELREVRFEVSVLGDLEAVGGEEDLDPARFGVVVSAAGDERRRGLLLPGVGGIETVEAQVRVARRKGGIGEDEAIVLMRFAIEKFAEGD